MLQLTIIGNLGQDAKIQVSNGNEFLSFSLAHNNVVVTVDETTGEEIKRETTYWVSVTSNQLKLAPYLKKGSQVFVQGDMSLRPYKDDKGQHQVGINLRASKIQLLGSKKETAEKEQTAEATA